MTAKFCGATKMSDKRDRVFAEKLRRAVTNGDLSTAKRLVKGGVTTDSRFWYDGTLLHEAVANCDQDMVKLLLQAGAKVNDKNKDNRTALHIACRIGKDEIVRELLKAKANINAQTKDGRTCLHVATWRGHTKVVECLLDAGANVNKCDEDGWTPLHWAAKSNLPSVAQMLIAQKAELNVKDKFQQTPLHESIINSNFEVMKVLLHHGADPNMKCNLGTTYQILLKKASVPADALRFLVETGYELHRDPSFHVTRIPHPAAYSDPELRVYLQHKHENIPHLSQLCRVFLRQHLSETSSGGSIVPLVATLPIPALLQEYIKCSTASQRPP